MSRSIPKLSALLPLAFLAIALSVDTAEAESAPTPSTVPAAEQASDGVQTLPWSQWRGPQRDGHVGDEWAWPADLDCLESRWRIELGKGYPGPIVTPDRVFVAETHNEEIEVVRALDRATGEELWRTEWPGAWNVPFFAKANGDWIRSTPAFDGSTLYVGGIREVLVALDGDTGEVLWTVDFPERYGTEVPPFGFASSPLVIGPHVYVQAANSLVKLDAATGQEVWRSAIDPGGMMSGGAFSSPTLAKVAGREQLLVQDRIKLHGVDPDSGEVLWSQEVPNFRGMNILTPTVHGNGIFTSSYQNGTYFYRVEEGEQGFETVEQWKYKASGYMSSPVVVGDHAYLHLGNGRLTCIDLSTGESTWTSKPFGKYWSLAVQGDRLLALDERGDLHLIEANPTELRLLGSRQVSEQPTWGHLAVAGDEIFVRELEAIAAYRWCEAPEGGSNPAAAVSAR